MGDNYKNRVEIDIQTALRIVRKLSTELQERVIQSILKTAARPILKEAKEKVPRGKSRIIRNTKGRRGVKSGQTIYKIGNLKKSLGFINSKTEIKGMSSFRKVIVGARTGGGKKNDGFYAHFVHEGHRSFLYGHDLHKQTEAKPWLRESGQAKEQEVIGNFRTAIVRVIKNGVKAGRIKR